jgi:hypothetical protein
MWYAGTTSVGANDLELTAFGCPPNKLGIFFYGTNAAQVPMGNGWRCVANPIHRIGTVTTDGFGDAMRALDFTAAADERRRRRDHDRLDAAVPALLPRPRRGRRRTNVTDGLAITFCP